MSNLSEIVYRRIDALYFPSDEGVQNESIDEILYQFAALGYELTENAKTLLSNTGVNYIKSSISVLMSRLTHTVKDRIVKKIEDTFTSSVGISESLNEELSKGLVKIDAVDYGSLEDLFTRLVEQSLPYSEQDILDVIEFSSIFSIANLRAKTRENNATLAGLYPEYNWTVGATVTDALRVAIVWSGGASNMTENVKFKLTRPQRKALISFIEKSLKNNPNALFDFARYREQWKRLFKALHPFEFKWAVNTQGIANSLYNNDVVSLNARIEASIKVGDVPILIERLSENPGVFARRLAEVIRKFPDEREEIVDSFNKVSSNVSTRVLLQAYNHFNGPKKDTVERTPARFKSRTVRDGFIRNQLDGDYDDVLESINSGLESKNKDVKIFIENDPTKELSDGIKVLTNNRSVANGGMTIGSGSRVKAGKSDFMVLFMHWRNLDDSNERPRVDLDLSARFYSDDFRFSEDIAYYRTDGIAQHSGDIISAPNGAEEYITIDVKKAKDNGYRYVLMSVYNYTGQNISDVPEAYAGSYSLDSLDSDFTASYVDTKFDLNSEAREVVPFIFDLETNEIIWVDMSFPGINTRGNLALSHNTQPVIENIINSNDLSVSELIEKTGGKLVNNKDEADVVIDPRKSDQVIQLLNS